MHITKKISPIIYNIKRKEPTEIFHSLFKKPFLKKQKATVEHLPFHPPQAYDITVSSTN